MLPEDAPNNSNTSRDGTGGAHGGAVSSTADVHTHAHFRSESQSILRVPALRSTKVNRSRRQRISEIQIAAKWALGKVKTTRLRIWGSGVRISSGAPYNVLKIKLIFAERLSCQRSTYGHIRTLSASKIPFPLLTAFNRASMADPRRAPTSHVLSTIYFFQRMSRPRRPHRPSCRFRCD